MKRTAWLLTVLLIATGALPATAAEAGGNAGAKEPPAQSGKAARKPGKIKMKLSLSAYHGYVPFDLTLTGKVDLPDGLSIRSCNIQTDWTNTTDVGLPFTTREEIPCVSEQAGIADHPTFKVPLTAEKAGTYVYRIILVDADGKQYASATREVKAVQSRVQVRATGRRNH
ncbi:MAG TPA: hypothetical protein VNI57_05605 [Candidatus Saccharimonadales bacterium]|nr:hypothetical protein [Candidatus Saccharimonadales bacterium]